MAALTLADESASCGAQQVSKSAIELGRHLHGCRLGFAQCGNLQVNRFRIDTRMIVREEIERHRRYFRQKLVDRRRICGGRYFVAMSGPNRGFVVPRGGDRENKWF